MRRSFALAFISFVIGTICVAQAQLGMTGIGGGFGGAAVYSGPGNVVGSAIGWWGLRAYSIAAKGNPAIRVCLASDTTCADFSSDATTGALVITTVGGSSCAVVTCTIRTWYDQSGGAACSGACDASQVTEARRPTLIVSCLSGKPCAQFATTGDFVGNLTPNYASGHSQPFTFSFVGQRYANFTTGMSFFRDNVLDCPCGFYPGTANQVGTYAGATLLATASDSAFNSVQIVPNSTSGVVAVNGSSTTGDTGTQSMTATQLAIGDGGNTGNFSYKATEFGFWGSGFSGTQISNMAANQQAFWGY